MRSVVGLVMQASGGLVEVDILELSRFPCPGVGLCHTSIGLGRRRVKDLKLKLTLGMAERRRNPPDEESWGGHGGLNLRQTQIHTLGVWLSLVQLFTAPVRHSPDVKQRPNKT